MSQQAPRYADHKRSGQTERVYRLDQSSESRLQWITHALRNAFRVRPGDARGSAIVRRALAVYAEHLDKALTCKDTKAVPMRAELVRRCEAARVRAAAEGSSLGGVATVSLLTDPVRPLRELLAEHASATKAGHPRKPLLELAGADLDLDLDDNDGENDDDD